MKRVPAMVATILLAVLLAAYVAMAPFAGPAPGGAARPALVVLDSLAAHLNSLAGRGLAIIGLLLIGGVLALLVGRAGKADMPAPRRKGGRPRESRQALGEQEGDPAFFRPESAAAGPDAGAAPAPAPEQSRIAALRRRAEAENATLAGASPQHEDAPARARPDEAAGEDETAGGAVDTLDDAQLAEALLLRPVVLVRKPRERDRDWTGDPSWLGGLPRLGDAPWPRDGDGAPLPFLAQIDLAEIAAARPECPLPASGSLAFFARLEEDGLAGAAVVAVAEGHGDFTDPPADLPPAYDESGWPFPERVSHCSRPVFPFWPVEAVPLDLPPPRGDSDGAAFEPEMRHRLGEALEAAIGARPAGDFLGHGEGEPGVALWWHGVHHLADRLQDLFAGAARQIAAAEQDVATLGERVDALEADPDVNPAWLAQQVAQYDRRLQNLARLREERDHLPPLLNAMEQFVDDRDPWQRLDEQEVALVADILAELHTGYPGLAGRMQPPASLAALETVSLRAMITGAPAALAALPEEILERINGDHAVPAGAQHRLFGCGADGRIDLGEDGIVLLQLARDDMMEWGWNAGEVIRFAIAVDDARTGNWSAARAAVAAD